MPPRARGIIKKIAKKGEYTVAELLPTVDFNGEEEEYMMMQIWPVHVLRPVNQCLTTNTPLINGQRISDALFPLSQGGTICILGAFSSGKTVIFQSASESLNRDIVICIG